LDLIEHLWALVKAPIFIEIKELLETCLSIVFWCPSVDRSLQHYAWVLCDDHLEGHKELCKNIRMFVKRDREIHKAQAILEKLEERMVEPRETSCCATIALPYVLQLPIAYHPTISI
jgi:hypothetical protein